MVANLSLVTTQSHLGVKFKPLSLDFFQRFYNSYSTTLLHLCGCVPVPFAVFFSWCFAVGFVPSTSICFMLRIKRETKSLTELCSPSIILEERARANRTSATLVRDSHNGACRTVLPGALVKISRGESRWECG